jgi:hypothetical protein
MIDLLEGYPRLLETLRRLYRARLQRWAACSCCCSCSNCQHTTLSAVLVAAAILSCMQTCCLSFLPSQPRLPAVPAAQTLVALRTKLAVVPSGTKPSRLTCSRLLRMQPQQQQSRAQASQEQAGSAAAPLRPWGCSASCCGYPARGGWAPGFGTWRRRRSSSQRGSRCEDRKDAVPLAAYSSAWLRWWWRLHTHIQLHSVVKARGRPFMAPGTTRIN